MLLEATCPLEDMYVNRLMPLHPVTSLTDALASDTHSLLLFVVTQSHHTVFHPRDLPKLAGISRRFHHLLQHSAIIANVWKMYFYSSPPSHPFHYGSYVACLKLDLLLKLPDSDCSVLSAHNDFANIHRANIMAESYGIDSRKDFDGNMWGCRTLFQSLFMSEQRPEHLAKEFSRMRDIKAFIDTHIHRMYVPAKNRCNIICSCFSVHDATMLMNQVTANVEYANSLGIFTPHCYHYQDWSHPLKRMFKNDHELEIERQYTLMQEVHTIESKQRSKWFRWTSKEILDKLLVDCRAHNYPSYALTKEITRFLEDPHPEFEHHTCVDPFSGAWPYTVDTFLRTGNREYFKRALHTLISLRNLFKHHRELYVAYYMKYFARTAKFRAERDHSNLWDLICQNYNDIVYERASSRNARRMARFRLHRA